jgi:1-acyl-sn-glycerol-3-phosphate acyltransferase
MLKTIRAFIRLLLFPTFTFWATVFILLFRLLRLPPKAILGVFNAWRKSQKLLLNIRVEASGTIPQAGAIIMANHRSYLDVAMIPSKTPVVFVAKASVKKWPIVGWGADALRTIWVDRSDPNSRKETRIKIVDRLKRGYSVIIFPEGTTSVGPGVIEFNPGMFYAVAGSGIPIVPVAIEYQNQNVAWVGNDTFVPHFMREFGARTLRVKVAFGEPLLHDDGEVLRSTTKAWIDERTRAFRAEYDAEQAEHA